MKKYILILLATSLLLSGCSIWSKDDLFQKKQECAKLEQEMWKQLDSNERYGGRMEWTSLYLSMIFYSPLRNSCLYKSEFIVRWDNGLWDSYLLEINDFFTKEIIHSQNCVYSEDNTLFSQCSESFDKEIQKFKWK